MDHLNLIALKKFPLIEPGDNLNEIILKSISDNNLLLEDGDILIIAQKIISKAENSFTSQVHSLQYYSSPGEHSFTSR